MALCRGLTAAKAMEYYFEKDAITNEFSTNANTAWHGKCAELLGLQGHIQSKDFAELLEGKLNGETLVGGVNGHRAGIDFTFCAPKAVSLLCYHMGDRKIERLHHEAVLKTLDYLEKNLVKYRYTEDGITYKKQSDNIVAAVFEHSTTRDNDPHLHSHATVLNITNTPNGFRAISNEKLYENQKLLLAIYHNYLGAELINKGYQIEALNSGYNVLGVSEEAIEKFSKRSRAINELIPELRNKFPKLDDIALRDMANFDTRKDKETITAPELYESWEQQFPREKLYTPPPIHEIAEIPDDKKIERAVNAIITTEVAFTKESIMTALLVQNVGKIKLEDCDRLIGYAEETNAIIKLNETHFSTRQMLELENAIVENVLQGKNAVKPLSMQEQVDNELKQHKELTDGQHALVKHIMTSKDRINIIQGDAGTGKTYAVDCLRQIIEKTDPKIELVGLGFTGKAAQELSVAANIKTHTIASFLNSDIATKNKILIVDEASMISSNDMKQLLDKSKDSRIVFIGDSKQLQAIGAGRMFKDLQKLKAVHVVEMNESMRQKTEHTKAVVKAIKDYQENRDDKGLDKAVDVLEQRGDLRDCLTINDSRKQTLEIYKSSDDTLVLTKTREEKRLLNEYIRNNILSQGQFDKQVKLDTKESVIKSSLSSGYKVGDDVIYGKKAAGIITKIDSHMNTLTLKTKKGSVIINPLETEISAYRKVERNFTNGDKVAFLKNDYRLGMQNGMTGTIKEVDKSGDISIESADGKSFKFNVKAYPYLEHGYAQTITKSQGQTCKQAVLVSNSCTTEDFYVAASRAKEEFKIITTNKDSFINSIHNGQRKTSSFEFAKVAHDQLKNVPTFERAKVEKAVANVSQKQNIHVRQNRHSLSLER